ncbi:MAG: Tex family protein [Myxococcota bacterium]|jgi:uncharacterized protein|nr:Tex family protein [Myxococcota bacterium]
MSEAFAFDPIPTLVRQLQLPASSVAAVVKLLGDGNTVPFIARYRKEATGNLDEVQIRAIEESHSDVLELEARRKTVLGSIEEQGKLSPELRAKILACQSKSELEDLYLPFKPKRRTRATMAREKGLEPLALRILEQALEADVRQEATAFINAELGVESVEQALAGARDIVAETIAETAHVRAFVREIMHEHGVLCSTVSKKQGAERTKFEQYYDYKERVASVPSHRYLAMRRGEKEEVLKVEIVLAESITEGSVIEGIIRLMGHVPASPYSEHLGLATTDAFSRLLWSSIESDLRIELKLRSDRDAVEVFATNLRNLLLAPPLGMATVIGIDPGLRTGCKCAVVDETGKFLEYFTINPHTGESRTAAKVLMAAIAKFQPRAIAVGNGTAGRETESFVRDCLAETELTPAPFVVLVNEAGASIYSASDVAREEFPELDLTIRGAISIARRLQDPLAELVKIDPKSIGVGQYQHDVHQPLLKRKLDEVVESCVNHVGVEVNTASAQLLQYVAGIGPVTAARIVKFRDENGRFSGRKQLNKVAGIGPKTFEQAAGFLRVKNGDHPLDASAVHPERYALVEAMAQQVGEEISRLVGNERKIQEIKVESFIGDGVGEPTLRDIISELKKPGRDPRERFEPPQFREDVREIKDLKPGMLLEGVVTNVTHFGAFVDVGVHQDGLVHISQLSERFVRDPSDVVGVGDRVKVKVIEVDLERKRIALSCRLDAELKTDEGSANSKRPAENAKPRRDGREGRDERGRKGGAREKAETHRSDAALTHNPFAELLNRNRK